jgi:mannose-1-phosphate guanylyltransferase/mannose-6-phosphate isomerase
LGATLKNAQEEALKGNLVLFGIPAMRPETGFGYIKADCGDAGANAFKVEKFIEKPDAQTAAEFVRSGEYFWNSGMFLFRASRYLDELRTHEPDIYENCVLALERSRCSEGVTSIDRATFECCPDNSIDYAVMEHTNRAWVVPLSAGWSDVGCWSSLWDVHDKDADGNVLKGDVISYNSRSCYVHGNSKLVTLLGVDNLVVIETEDALMVAHRDTVQDVKKLVNALDAQHRSETQNNCAVYRPWGSYHSVDNGIRHQVKHITVKPGAQLSLQMHHHRAEHWIVVSGTAQVTCNDKVFLLTENQSTYLPIASVHRLANPGKIPLEVIEVQTGSYLGEDDIKRLEDVYGRNQEVKS